MGWSPSQGDKVVASQFGPALVRRVMRRTVLIRLEKSGLQVEVDLDALTPEQPGAVDQEDRRDSTVGGLDITSRREATRVQEMRSAVEALRFGLVPETKIESLTLHYQEFQSWVLSRLPIVHGGKPQVSEIYGPFGSGKSHTMAAVRYVARQQGYVAARVEVDGLSITLSDPARLLYSLWSSVKAKEFESATPILDLCLKAIQAGHPAPSIAPRGIDRVHDNYSTARLIKRPDLLDNYGHALDAIMVSSDEFTASEVNRMISGDPDIYAFEVRVRRMIGQRVVDRPYDFVETWVGYAILSKLAGYKGLVITIDEFEVERLLSALKFNRVTGLLDVLRAYLKGDLDHPSAPLSVFFATVGEDGHLGDRFVDQLIDEARGDYYPLQGWSPEDRAELSRQIFKLYSEAYGLSQEYSRSVADSVEAKLAERGAGDSGLIRTFIKSYVGALDFLYGPRR